MTGYYGGGYRSYAGVPAAPDPYDFSGLPDRWVAAEPVPREIAFAAMSPDVWPESAHHMREPRPRSLLDRIKQLFGRG